MGGEFLVTSLALIGIVIVVSALLSGLIDRSGLPQVAVFIAIGAALGPAGLGLFNITLDSPVVRVVATLSLTLVLFTDAVSLNISRSPAAQRTRVSHVRAGNDPVRRAHGRGRVVVTADSARIRRDSRRRTRFNRSRSTSRTAPPARLACRKRATPCVSRVV